MTEANTPETESEDQWRVLRGLLTGANNGDRDALEGLRQFLDQNPQIWRQGGDLGRAAERAWIKLVANGDALSAEVIQRQLVELKKELIGETPTIIEKMLAETIVANWLEAKYLESAAARGMGGNKAQAGHFLRRLESSQKRYLAAIKSLVQTRKLLPTGQAAPDLRIFHGEKDTA